MDSMMIPFIMLLMVTVALVLERKFQEEKIVEIYEKKFENWKEHTPTVENEKKCKELVGLVFVEGDQLNIEVLDTKIKDRLERKRFTIKG